MILPQYTVIMCGFPLSTGSVLQAATTFKWLPWQVTEKKTFGG